MDGRDLLFAVEEQSVYLEDSVTLLCHLTTELNNELLQWEENQNTPGTAAALRRIGCFNVLLRDMFRISDDLKTAVSKGFEELKNAD